MIRYEPTMGILGEHLKNEQVKIGFFRTLYLPPSLTMSVMCLSTNLTMNTIH